MFWNTGLYYYYRLHGGTFLGLSQEDEPNATLLLPGEKGAVELCPVLRGFTRYNTNWDAAARLSVTLERPFTLRVKPENDLRPGMRPLLKALDAGAELMEMDTQLSMDYGYPELRKRPIKASEPAFAKWIFQSEGLRQLLSHMPDMSIQICPLGPDSREHVVAARMHMEWLNEPQWSGEELTPRQQGERCRDAGLFDQLDALVSLAREAARAVTQWPMPVETK